MLVNGERALAYIVTIDDITPIDGADNIELARVGGWRCIVNKEQFKPGDAAVFFEIDSLVPETEWSEFLRPKKFRVKTYKLNRFKVVSQGLLMPMDILPKGKTFNVGDDVTKVLGVTYYVKEDNYRKAKDGNPNEKYNRMAAKHPKLAKKKWFRWFMKRMWGRKLLFVFLGRHIDEKKYKFPAWIKRTNEDRIENCMWIFESKEPFVCTEKIDGCFDYNTKIRTNEGHIPIGRIVNQKLPVLVASYNEDKQIVEYKHIVDYHKIKVSHPVLKIGVGYRGHGNRDKYITCTDNHEFYTPTGWKQAKYLKQGDIVYHFTESFPYEIKQLILGSLLGDASINANDKDGGYRCVHFSQSDKQIAYFNYKKNLLGKYALGERTRTSGYGSLMHDMHTTTNLEINKFLNEHCIKNGKKFVTQEWCNELDPMGLAFWYMDDGSISNRDNDRLGCRIHISTNGFSLQENKTLANMLRDRFGIKATIGDKETYKGHTLILDVKNTERFCSLIAPYVCDSMKYKLPKKYQDIKCCYDNICFDSGMNIVEVDIKSIENIDEHKEYFFDLTIEDNHNYFVQSILVHNCSTTFFLDATKRKHDFGVCSRNVRQMTPDQENYHTSEDVGNVYWEMALKYDMQNALEDIAKKYNVQRVVLQGETYGEAIQGNPLHLKHRDFAAFNLVFDGERLGSIQAKEILDNYKIPFVPIVDDAYYMPDTFEELKKQADGKSTINHKCLREGFVYRSYDGKQSAKNVSVKYLLKQKD